MTPTPPRGGGDDRWDGGEPTAGGHDECAGPGNDNDQPAAGEFRTDSGARQAPGTAGDDLTRRHLLATAGAVVGTSSLAGCSVFEGEENTETATVPAEQARTLAEQFAPTVYFDEHEPWFPTDPRPYETEADGETVVDGFAAFDGYTQAFKESGEPPSPTLFYNAVQYADSPLAVIQFWYYSAFDQFTTNFHWHDWEVLHVFVDTDTEEPQLYVASSHSRKIPNNEHLDPDPDQDPRILSELGSHASALSVNDAHDQFQRLPGGDVAADITNSGIEGLEEFAETPLAYGLPRDEGSRLPFLVPDLDGETISEHDRLPSVEASDLIGGDLAIGSFDELTSPPTDLPQRSTGQVFRFAGRDEPADVEYELVPASEVEHITGFTGPQLSFEFRVPQFAEDAVAGHITSTSVPWSQPRYADPATDISDSNHRLALAERYDAIGAPAPVNTVVARVAETIADEDAPTDEGVTTSSLSVESVALLESEPEAVPTSGGVAILQDVSAGDHQLTVNGAGVEPHSEPVTVADDDPGAARAGVEGTVPLVAREDATKLEVDTEGTDVELTDLAVEDDFAGRLYDASLSGPDAVYVHGGGAYTVEVADVDEDLGAFRVNPGDEARTRIAEPRTGKGSLADYLAEVADETARAVVATEEADGDDEDDDTTGNGSSGDTNGSENAVQGLARALEAVAAAATRAAERAAAGDKQQAEQSLSTVRERLERVSSRLADAQGDLPDDIGRAADRRLDQLDRRSKQAEAASKL